MFGDLVNGLRIFAGLRPAPRVVIELAGAVARVAIAVVALVAMLAPRAARADVAPSDPYGDEDANDTSDGSSTSTTPPPDDDSSGSQGEAITPIDLTAPTDVELHINGGLDLAGGDGVFATGFRGRVSLGKAFGSGTVRPQLALGALFGVGRLYTDDPRALDGTLALGYVSYGPELQAGLRFVDGGTVDSRVFASVALLRVSMDERLMLDHVPGISNESNTGIRASIGGNWADRQFGKLDARGNCETNCSLSTILLPQQAEIVWERDAGSDRLGVTLSWGL